MGISVKGLVKRYGSTAALDGVSLDVPDGALLSVLGPSGSGKTTLLRCVAGLEEPESGTIRIGDKVVFDSAKGVNVPPEERGIGMVFQSNALWPHMTVWKNVAYPLEIRGDKSAGDKVSEALDLLKLGALADRLPSEISGGEQQRVALARAIVYKPSLVLLDEPFSNLDVLLRESLRDEVRQLQLKLGMTMLYVTHDRVDAMSVGDELAILSSGEVVAFGRPGDLLSSPPNSYTARFLGGMIVVDGVASPHGGGTRVSTRFGSFDVPASHREGKVKLCIPPAACRLSAENSPGTVPGTLSGSVLLPSGFRGLRVSTESGTVEIHTPLKDEPVKPGAPVYISADPSMCLILES